MVAQVEQVAELLGRPITDEAERKQVEAWIRYADLLVRRRYPRLDELTESHRIDPDAVDLVEAMAVARYSLNPEGVTSRTTSIDDMQETQGMRNALPNLVIMDDEWALITPIEVRSSGAFTIAPAGHPPCGDVKAWW